MSFLAKLVRSTNRAPLRNQVAKVKPGTNRFRVYSKVLADSAEQVRKWMTTMTSKAVSNESKNYVVQLSSVNSFFNRPAQAEEIPVP